MIRFTVFSAEELRDAQAHPEMYENLQMRVYDKNSTLAESNVYFNRLVFVDPFVR